ncbi:MAG: phage terminase large subunit [Clostridia bacterium]|nr:phage terminase large subunit [Clostridia bacterium]
MGESEDKSLVKTVKISGTPNKKQAEFFASRAKYTAYGGARGGGKSWALRRKLVALCLRYAGARCLIIRRSYAELKLNHLGQFLEEYGAFIKYSEADKCLSFPNGSRIFFGYCSSDRDVLRYQGQEYDVVAIDEATQLTEYQFSIFSACVRGVNDRPKRIYLTCNPGGVGHAWVKRLFIDRDFRGGENPDDYLFIQALVTDNEVLMERDSEYVGRLKSLSPKLRDAWLYGRWDVFEGQFFSEFDHETHVCTRSELPEASKYFLAFDYGFDMLAALLMCVDSGGRVFVADELCVPGLTLSEAAVRIVGAFANFRPEYAVASPDLWNRRQDSGLSGFEIMQRTPGMPPMIAADDRRIPGWRVVREYLGGSEGDVKLKICSVCTELIHSMTSLLCDKNRAEDAAGEPHSVTHAPEALRYGLMSRFNLISSKDEFLFSKKRTGPGYF